MPKLFYCRFTFTTLRSKPVAALPLPLLKPGSLKPGSRGWQALAFGLGFALVSSVGTIGSLSSDLAIAQAPSKPTPPPTVAPASAAPPAPLAQFITNLDAAANSRDAKAVLDFYNPNFVHSDGLTKQTLQDSLAALWKRYPNLTYRTEIKSWKPQGSGYVAETVTTITGTQKEGDREFKLDSTLEIRHQIENQKIVRQDILQERSQITSGSKPPILKVNLPDQVRGGQEFTFDAIVQEPLGDDLLMGAALEEPIKPDGYLNNATANLEPLNSGGIFKVGRAPLNSQHHWLSAVVVRYDGITMVTQRLRILGQK